MQPILTFQKATIKSCVISLHNNSTITNEPFNNDIILSFLLRFLASSWNWIRLFETAKDRICSKPEMVQSIQKLIVDATFPGMVFQELSQNLVSGFQAILTGKVESIEKHSKDRKILIHRD